MIRIIITTACVILALVVSGCAPKRIVKTEPPPQVVRTSPEPVSDPFIDHVTFGIQVAELARQQLGKPYQWGAAGPDRFDCSGLAFFVFGSLGVDLPRVSSDQAAVGTEISISQLQPGDLLFFALDGPRINHVGVFIGNQKFVHAPRRYLPVRINSLHDSYWRQRMKIARRIHPAP